jgi:hypothetical protein
LLELFIFLSPPHVVAKSKSMLLFNDADDIIITNPAAAALLVLWRPAGTATFRAFAETCSNPRRFAAEPRPPPRQLKATLPDPDGLDPGQIH